ncbi:hypothetical protein KDA_18390 [Dictyobacter alpinus]|uniref:Uncharacterized protein n=1 Tax=Dictyobacter alpinus TaxID=2014873 RepID=A0A402B4R9_9CHLR|nr:hypothetical protein [Dictyobacter alpinus]GCE26355.1 hypothetical protein KDA_18390 [Dictyobacter alpinus]
MPQKVKYILLLVIVFLLGALITVAIIIPDNISSLGGGQGTADTAKADNTPMANLPPAEQVRQLAQTSNAFANLSGSINTKYTAGKAEITESLYKLSDVLKGRDQVKHDCFTMQRAIWNASIKQLNSVKIVFKAPVTDKYGKVTPDEQVASCTLNSTTAQKIVWENLSYQRAWDGTIGTNPTVATATVTADLPQPTPTAAPNYVYDAHGFVGFLAAAPASSTN